MKGDKELNCGDFDYRISNKDMAVYKWIDNEAVKVIPDFHGTERNEITTTQKDGSKK